jgi:hypothetical protein
MNPGVSSFQLAAGILNPKLLLSLQLVKTAHNYANCCEQIVGTIIANRPWQYNNEEYPNEK